MSWREIEDMPIHVFHSYYKSIPILESQELLRDFKVASYNEMKPDARRTLHRRVTKVAYPDSMESVKPLKAEDLARVLKSRMN